MFFKNCEIEIYNPIEIENSFNPYTGEEEHSYELIETVPASFQNNTSSDSVEDYGKQTKGEYKIYTNLNKNINDKTIIKIKGKDDEYKLIGLPYHYNHFIYHTKLEVDLLRKRVL